MHSRSASAGQWHTWLTRVACALALVSVAGSWSATGLAAEHALPGRGHAALHASDTSATAAVVFARDPVFATVPDPRCPATSSLRLVWSANDVREIALPCENWRRTASSMSYFDASASAGGVQRIFVDHDQLKLRLTGTSNTPTPGSMRYLEVALTVGAESYCGRFQQFDVRSATKALSHGPPGACLFTHPNILVVLLDDVRVDGVDHMPVLQQLAAQGVSFRNAFTPTSSCAASRASILTGLYPMRHNTFQVSGPIGGAHVFRETGDDLQTVAVWLGAAGYQTGLFGKYINDYGATEQNQGPSGTFYTPPGWDRWWAFAYNEHYGGILGQSYQIVDERHRLTSYTDHTTDVQYSTDLTAETMRTFITNAVGSGQRFFAYWAPYAAHGETPDIVPEPAKRHEGLFASLPLWRPASWNESNLSDKPRWEQKLQAVDGGPSGSIVRTITDLVREHQYEALLSADEELGLTLQRLQDLAVDEDTLILLTSDNGLGWGEHQVWGGKGCPYEECQRVTMQVRYPRHVSTAPVDVEATVSNNDIAPTVASFAGATIPYTPDGQDLRGWLTGPAPPTWQNDYILSNWRPSRGDRLAYSGQVSDGDRVRIFFGNTRAQPRLSLIFEFDSGDGVTAGAVPVAIGVDANATFSSFAQAVQQNVPSTQATVNTTQQLVVITPDVSDADTSVYVWKEVDRGNVMDPDDLLPDFLGVRDVANGYTWVEYETGERELYDLTTDPAQLQNRADDPAYVDVRQQLEARLVELLAEVAAR